MKLLSQPFDEQLGNFLLKSLDSGEYNRLNIAVAFAKNSGVLRLRDALIRFRDGGGEIHIYVGVDMNGTSYEALMNLFPIATTLRLVHDENGQTFHTKLFNFVSSEKSDLVVGSHNLTGGGLWTNYESSIQVSLDLKKPADLEIQKSVEKYLDVLDSLTKTSQLIEDQDVIQELLDNHYVEKEVKTRVKYRRASETAPRRQTVLFGATKRAPLPSLPQTPEAPRQSAMPPGKLSPAPSTAPSSLSEIEDFSDETLWLETRKMTGGSRNILDLSKTSLLRTGTVAGSPYEHGDSNFMRGAVEFFGVAPEDTDREKQIVVNFEGIDYAENIIKFPSGDRANGTWRVQIKGISPKGERITSAFKRKAEGGYLLPNKIVTFTRIREDYYYLSVFEESALSEFLETSAVTAYNGRSESAKLLGIL